MASSFLDRKEQVIDLKLTKFGEFLLSKGLLSPAYYAFIDDDVIYDNNYAGVSNEVQNEIHGRIKEASRPATQHAFHGLETDVVSNNNFIRSAGLNEKEFFNRVFSQKVQPIQDKHYAVSAPLGTISLESDNAPAWSIDVLQGEITGTVVVQTGSMPTIKIPLLTMKPILFKTESMVEAPMTTIGAGIQPETFGVTGDTALLTQTFKDGSFINIYEDRIIIEIEELNTLTQNENFDLEIYQVTSSVPAGNKQEKLIPLYFSVFNKSLIKNGILLDDVEIQKQNSENAIIDQTSVEFFFDLLIDDEVDKNVICAFANNKNDNLMLNRLDCEEPVVASQKQLYSSNITEEDLKGCK
jgi:hypothetical protein